MIRACVQVLELNPDPLPLNYIDEMVGHVAVPRVPLSDALSDLAVVLAERLMLRNVGVEVRHLKTQNCSLNLSSLKCSKW